MIHRPAIDELHRVPEGGKAEIIGGKVVPMSPTGGSPGRAAGRIYFSLTQHEDLHGGGFAFPDNVGFLVDLPERQSFSPDAAWYVGDVGDVNMDFLAGAPAFAVEVRSKNDYGPHAETEVAAKIREYHQAGCLVVWDVDLLADDVIRIHRAGASPVVFRRGEVAHAEPAVPGWQFAVDDLFR
jgi:Uma2 family endonuclease